MYDDDIFDSRLQQALHGTEEPAADFTQRVMARVAKTPQDKARPSSHRRWVTWGAGLAACCALVLLTWPLLRQGSNADSAQMDTMTTEDTMELADGAVSDAKEEKSGDGSVEEPMEGFMTTLPPTGVTDDTEADNAEADDGDLLVGMDGLTDDLLPALYVTEPDDVASLRTWLSGRSITPERMADGTVCYTLTAEQATALGEALPQVDVAAGEAIELYLPAED